MGSNAPQTIQGSPQPGTFEQVDGIFGTHADHVRHKPFPDRYIFQFDNLQAVVDGSRHPPGGSFIRVHIDVQFIQHFVQGNPVACLRARHRDSQRIAFHIADIERHMAGIYFFRYRFYHTTGHRSSRRITDTRLADHDNTGIFRSIGREITAESDLVAGLAIDTARCDLRRTGLSGYPDEIGTDSFTRPFLHDA